MAQPPCMRHALLWGGRSTAAQTTRSFNTPHSPLPSNHLLPLQRTVPLRSIRKPRDGFWIWPQRRCGQHSNPMAPELRPGSSLTTTQARHGASRSGKKCSPATSSTRRPKTTRERRSVRRRWRTTTSACITRKRCAPARHCLPASTTDGSHISRLLGFCDCKLPTGRPRPPILEKTPRTLDKYGTWDCWARTKTPRRCSARRARAARVARALEGL